MAERSAMDGSQGSFLDRLRDWLEPAQLWQFLCRERTRYVLSWLAAGGAVVATFLYGWFAFADPWRPDGNSGHTQIDFGGQWLMARMLVEGHGRELYNRDYQRQVLHAAYPIADQDPNAKSDAEQLMGWTMGNDDPDAVRRVGGPLYPPIHAVLHYPFGLLLPQPAYRVMQLAVLLLGLVSAWGVSYLSGGRIWLPVALTAIVLYPGFSAAVNLGQNAALTLAILVWGWAFIARGQDGWGGAVWGLLAFKPVWAMAFFLVLVLSGRCRAGLAMLVAGAALAGLTLPLVGLQGWEDWLAIGREAALLYNVDENWIRTSRDLLSIPRRWLIDFQQPLYERDTDWLPPAVIGWTLLAGVLELTVRVAVWGWATARAAEGAAAAFLLLGAWLTCFHFMYYDVLLTVLPVCLLFTEPRRYLKPRLVGLLPAPRLGPDELRYFEPRSPWAGPPPLTLLETGRGRVWVLNGAVPTLVALLYLSLYVPGLFGLSVDKIPPLDTFCLIALWLCCGWLWLKEKAVHVNKEFTPATETTMPAR